MIIIDTSTKRDLTLAPKNETEIREQGLYILVNTILGECPLYRGFGVSNDYLHMPVNLAKTAFTLAVTEAIRKYFPNMRLVNIRFNQDNIQGKLNPVLEVTDIG